MDSINVERIHALRRYKQQQYLNTLLFYPIVTLTCVVFCTSPFWLPSIYSSFKSFLCDSIPTILSFFFNAKSLFILGNLIVIFLLGESKIQASDSSSLSLPRKIDVEKAKKKKKKRKDKRLLPEAECNKKEQEVVKMVYVEVKEKEEHQVEEVIMENVYHEEEKIEEYVEDEEEEIITELSAEELNRRADDFIARVNKQIRFEADHEVLLCSY